MTARTLPANQRTHIIIISWITCQSWSNRSRFGRRQLRFENLATFGCIKPGKGENVAVTGGVGTEGSVACAAGIVHGVTGSAGSTESLVMQADPIRVEMCIRFWSGTQLDFGHEVVRAFYNRDRMADITFETDRLLLAVKVFAIVATETTRRVDMTEIIWVCCPIDLLIMKYGAVVNILNGLNGRTDLFSVPREIFSSFVISRQLIKCRKGIGAGGVLSR